LHYDLRLEMDGALASWAIPKGPSYDPAVRRLAVETEDHPLEYGGFEGRIPEGEYGAGDSIIWDRGVYETVPPGQATFMRGKGHLHFVLAGEKLKGAWHLVRTRGAGRAAARPGDRPQWILFKAQDPFASTGYDVVAERPESVVSGKKVTRGPAPAAVRAGPGEPVRVLLQIWPPLAFPTSRRTSFPAARYLLEPWGAGPRALAGLSRGRVALQSEEGRDLAAAQPDLVRALAALPATEAAIDGEIAEGARFVAHDLLWLDGQDLRARPLEERLEMLAELFRAPDARLALAARDGRGARVLARVRGAPYAGGSGEWVARERR
jgi:bifunctional non-homologous end joining protein LigD